VAGMTRAALDGRAAVFKNWSMHSNSSAQRKKAGEAAPGAPLQERSRATRDRILAALRQLLETKTFDQISVAELTVAAGCSMSSFYARFPTKDALLSAFHERFFEVSAAQSRGALAHIAQSDAAPAERLRKLVEFVLVSYRAGRGLLRSLILHDRLHKASNFSTRTRDQKQRALDDFLAVMRDDKGRPIAKHARAAAGFALWLVFQAIEQVVLFDDPMMGAAPLSDRELVAQLTAVLAHAVNAPPPKPKRAHERRDKQKR
jgi:AcrR family transcriptional regulator